MTTANLSRRKLIYLADMRLPTDWAHGIQIMKMCEAFAQTGIEVELVVPRRFNKIKENPFQYYNIRRKFKITKLPCIDLMPLSASKLIFLLEKLSFLVAAKFFLSLKKFNILYTREPLAGLFWKNFILEAHVLPKRIKSINLYFWQRAKALVVLTNFIKDKMTAIGVTAEKILVAPDGVDVADFNLPLSPAQARQAIGLPADKKLVIYSGSFSLYSWKGVDVLLEAAHYLPDNAIVVLVGGSEAEVQSIKSKITTDNVLLVGRQPYAKISYYLAAADVLVLPNKAGDIMSEQYTSPLKMFEYMASGRPIVASDLAGLREIL